MPVDIWNKKLVDNADLKAFLANDEEIDQVWAEAVHMWRKGEKLYLSAEAEKTATVQQSMHSEVDERRGIIEDYLDRLLPQDWDDKDIFERRSYLEDPLSPKGTVLRDYVCIAEIWCECLGKNKEKLVAP